MSTQLVPKRIIPLPYWRCPNDESHDLEFINKAPGKEYEGLRCKVCKITAILEEREKEITKYQILEESHFEVAKAAPIAEIRRKRDINLAKAKSPTEPNSEYHFGKALKN